MGFSVPLDEWLSGPLREWAESLISIERLSNEGYLNPILVRSKWDEHISGKRNWKYQLWNVLMFQSWLESIEK
jgi:asparagine synthase (glutamine-hydrolysing)